MHRRAARNAALRRRPGRFHAHACVQPPTKHLRLRASENARPPCSSAGLLPWCVSRFAQVTLGEVLGRRPPRAFEGMDEAERERLYWDLKSRSTALRGHEHVAAQTPPVRFGPNRVQTPQPRPARRTRILSAEERRARLAQEGQPAAPPPPQRVQPAAPPPPAEARQGAPPPTASQHGAPQFAAAHHGAPPPPTAASQFAAPPTSSQHGEPPQAPASQAQHMEWSPFPAPPPPSQPGAQPAAAQPAQPPNMEWSPTPQPIPFPPSGPQSQSPLFPARPQVFCIPATPSPVIPSRPLFFSLPAHPPPFPQRTSVFCLNAPPPIPPRPFIFPVAPPGFHRRPYFMSGECVRIGSTAIPERLFFMSGHCVSEFFSLISLMLCLLCRFLSNFRTDRATDLRFLSCFLLAAKK